MAQHGGNIYSFAQKLQCAPDDIIDFSSNINPHQAVVPQIESQQLRPYADPDYYELHQIIKQRYPEFAQCEIELFNGASAAIFALLRFLNPENLVLYAPLYAEYRQVGELFANKVQLINRFEAITANVPRYSTIVFVNPSTPDGQYYPLEKLIAEWKKACCILIVDESFLDFTHYSSAIELLKDYPNFFIIKSFTKFYGCAGVRVGFIAGNSQSIKLLHQQEPIWKLSSFDVLYIQNALKNKEFITETRKNTQIYRQWLKTVFTELNWVAFEGNANFLLVKLTQFDGHALQRKLAPYKILVRVCDNFDFLDAFYVRFAVKAEKDILLLQNTLEQLI